MTEELRKLLPSGVYWAVRGMGDITELRLRRDKPLVMLSRVRRRTLEYIVTDSDIEYVLRVASGYAMYAVEDTVRRGYIACSGGIRIGLSGEGVLNGDRLQSLKNISSLVIRVPHEVGGLPENVAAVADRITNTLIISPPCAGKTTLLRQLVKYVSDRGIDTLVIDERGELSATSAGRAMFDVGQNTDIMYGIPKLRCYEGGVRSMSPRVIATDEIFGAKEVECLLDMNRCGMRFFATVHSDSIDKVMSDSTYQPLVSVVDNYILLSDKPRVGSVKEIRQACLC